ncbi:MAG TPA: DUF177 domain-containing protein [Bacteroidetes bacterium]|nr:DUF177 domain-containing protein [Bacteroidota bacterium]
MDNELGRTYSIELSKLAFGLNEEVFDLNRSFFEAFELSLVKDGNLTVKAEITKNDSHLDALFRFSGDMILECDRCTAPFPHPLEIERRIIFSYDAELEFDEDEVVIIERKAQWLDFSIDFFDFINLEVPIRKVPPVDVHLCPPDILKILGMDEKGNVLEPVVEEKDENAEEVIDPRWAKLKKLKDLDNK